MVVFKITTDSGLIGWGEQIIEGKARTVQACVKKMEDYLIGENLNNIEDIWLFILIVLK